MVIGAPEEVVSGWFLLFTPCCALQNVEEIEKIQGPMIFCSQEIMKGIRNCHCLSNHPEVGKDCLQGRSDLHVVFCRLSLQLPTSKHLFPLPMAGGGGLDDLLKFLPTQASLWFHDSVIFLKTDIHSYEDAKAWDVTNDKRFYVCPGEIKTMF